MRFDDFAKLRFFLWFLLVALMFDESTAHIVLALRLARNFDSICPDGCRLDVCVKQFQHVYVEGEKCIFGDVHVEVQSGGVLLNADELRILLRDTTESISILLKVRNSTQPNDQETNYFWSGSLPKEFRRFPLSNIFFRGQCEPHFYGSECKTFCKVNSTDEENGHVVCNEKTGERQCATGFTGTDCSKSPTIFPTQTTQSPGHRTLSSTHKKDPSTVTSRLPTSSDSSDRYPYAMVVFRPLRIFRKLARLQFQPPISIKIDAQSGGSSWRWTTKSTIVFFLLNLRLF